jgi:hypothetical protein
MFSYCKAAVLSGVTRHGFDGAPMGKRIEGMTSEQRAHARAAVRRYDQEHREERRAYIKKWRQQNRTRRSAYNKRWYEENRERIRAHRKINYEKNRDHINERRRQLYHEQKVWNAKVSKDGVLLSTS